MLLSIRLARDSLKHHKARSILAATGVTISVLIISLVLILTDSLHANLSEQAHSLPEGAVIVNGGSDRSSFNVTPTDTLNNHDQELIEQSDDVRNTISSLILNGGIQIDGKTANTTIVATNTTYRNAVKLKMASGNWLDAEDSDKNWVILGYSLANQLLGTDEVQNQVVNIKGHKYTVVGVFDRVKEPLSILGYNINQSAFISLTKGQDISKSDHLSQIVVYPEDSNDNNLRHQVGLALGKNHADGTEYTVSTTSTLASQLMRVLNIISIIAFIFAGLALFISGVSIMNVMLVSASERRREIGIRKAVGATTRNILNQFLAESLIISLNGGIAGILLAYLIALIIAIWLSIGLTFSWSAIAVGFALPVAVGVFFGAYPAYRAARGDIITALRQLT